MSQLILKKQRLFLGLSLPIRRGICSTFFLMMGFFLLVPLSAAAQSPSDQEPAVDALVLVEASTITDMDEAVNFIGEQGGLVMVTFSPHALLVRLPISGAESWIGQAGITAVHTGPVNADAIETIYGFQAGLAARVWNDWLTPPAAPTQPPAEMPPDDLLIPPAHDEITILNAPQWYQTSAYLYGSVQVDMFLPESNGSFDSSTENWSSTRRNQVVSEVTAGLTWWASTATQGGRPGANLNFNLTVHDPFNEPGTVTTRYEPIRRPSTDDDLWIEEIMGRLGYNDSAYTAARLYAHDRRTSLGRKWGLVIFVVDSYNDSDGKFTNGKFGYAYLGGPYLVMTYDNNGWGIADMEIVTAHELAHIFGALDEYATSGCTTSQRSGYLNVANTNCENGTPTEESIMRSASSQEFAYANHLASIPVRGMVGWRDSDSDGLYDPVDTTPTLSLNSFSPDPTTNSNLTYSGVTRDVPYVSPTHTDATINTITAVQYRVDGGGWQSCSPTDGSFNAWQESFSCSVSSLADGTHTVQARSRNSVNHYSGLAADTITVDTTPPGNPTTVDPGCTATNNVWQHTCNDPAFTWSGATDATTGVNGYQLYWGTNPTGTSSTWTTTAGYNPAPVSAGSHYLRLRTRDTAGNWSSWITLFTLRYDDTPPTLQIVTPAADSYLNTDFITVQANGSDTPSGLNQFQFFAGYDDGSDWAWHLLGWDIDGTDGWNQVWDASSLADQSDVAFYAYVWDKAYNLVGEGVDNITLDRTPPTSAAQPLPTTLNSTTFIFDWSGSDALAGLDSYDIQYRDDPDGVWTNLWTSVPYSYTSGWFTGQIGHTYYFRTRARDLAGNLELYPGEAGDTHVFIEGCTGDAYEEDDSYQTATWLAADSSSTGHTFCGPADEDWLAFQATAGRQYLIETSNLPYWTDTYLYLYDTDGQTLLAENDDIDLGINRASRLEWTAPADGTYYLMVRDWNNGTAGNGVTYDISLSVGNGFNLYLPLVQKQGLASTQTPPSALPPDSLPLYKSQGLIPSGAPETPSISTGLSFKAIPPPPAPYLQEQ